MFTPLDKGFIWKQATMFAYIELLKIESPASNPSVIFTEILFFPATIAYAFCIHLDFSNLSIASNFSASLVSVICWIIATPQ